MSLTLGVLLAVSVSVDLSAVDAEARARLDMDRLHGQLLVRLAEEGFAVRASANPTSYRVHLRLAQGDRVVLRVAGEEMRTEELAAAPLAVLHLMLVQRALVLLDEVPPAPVRPPALPRVFVEFPARADRESANRMYGSAAVAVVERGFELVGAVRRAEFLVCLSSTGDPVWVSAEAVSGCDQQAVAVAMPSGASEPLGWRLGLAGGAMARGNHLDPSSALSLRLGRDDGPCGVVLGRFTPVEEHGLDLVEMAWSAGPGWRFSAGRLALETSLLAGVLRQRYQRYAEAAHLRWSWILSAPVDLSFGLGPSWRLHAAVLPSVTRDERFYPRLLPEGPLEDTGAWADGAFQVAVDAGLSFGF